MCIFQYTNIAMEAMPHLAPWFSYQTIVKSIAMLVYQRVFWWDLSGVHEKMKDDVLDLSPRYCPWNLLSFSEFFWSSWTNSPDFWRIIPRIVIKITSWWINWEVSDSGVSMVISYPIYKWLITTHMLHVWNIYQHLPHKWPSHVGKYTSTMEHMGISHSDINNIYIYSYDNYVINIDIEYSMVLYEMVI